MGGWSHEGLSIFNKTLMSEILGTDSAPMRVTAVSVGGQAKPRDLGIKMAGHLELFVNKLS